MVSGLEGFHYILVHNLAPHPLTPQVLEDHLKYYRKREDYESGKEPISLMRLSQVRDITEAVFHAVPKKHHLNCGFALVAFHEKSKQEQTFNLLAEVISAEFHLGGGGGHLTP